MVSLLCLLGRKCVYRVWERKEATSTSARKCNQKRNIRQLRYFQGHPREVFRWLEVFLLSWLLMGDVFV